MHVQSAVIHAETYSETRAEFHVEIRLTRVIRLNRLETLARSFAVLNAYTSGFVNPGACA